MLRSESSVLVLLECGCAISRNDRAAASIGENILITDTSTSKSPRTKEPRTLVLDTKDQHSGSSRCHAGT